MVCFPNAKINLGLNILSKRSDGYHNIETVFYPVQWHDALEIMKSEVGSQKSEEKIKFNSSGLIIEGDEKNNLCVKAFDLLDKEFGLPQVKMHLHKVIPLGAGLGGGSSDGAFTLQLLNELFDLKLSKDNLKNYAKQLGSDCSFFVENVPVLAKGRGELLEKINLSLAEYFILIAKPDVHISTAEAYELVRPEKSPPSLKEIIQLPIIKWKDILKNDFEKSVFEKFPVIEALKNKMYQQGAVYASMSGSGSTVYGIFKKKSYDKNVFKNCHVWEGVMN